MLIAKVLQREGKEASGMKDPNKREVWTCRRTKEGHIGYSENMATGGKRARTGYQFCRWAIPRVDFSGEGSQENNKSTIASKVKKDFQREKKGRGRTRL